MRPSQILQPHERHKANFRNFLGGESRQDLAAIIGGSLRNDYLKKDSQNVFDNLTLDLESETHPSLPSIIAQNSKNALNSAFKSRWKIAFASTVGFFAAFGASFGSPAAGLALSALTVASYSIAEGPFKRTISGIGHFEGHFAEKILNLTKTLLSACSKTLSEELSESGAKEMQNLFKEIDGSNSKLKSGLARLLSYFSTPAVSATQKGLTLSSVIAKTASTVFGAVIPILPLLTVGLSRFASQSRHQNSQRIAEIFDKASEIIFNPSSYKSGLVPEEVFELTTQFGRNLATCDNHGLVEGQKGYHRDKPATATKKAFDGLKSLIIVPSKFCSYCVNLAFRAFKSKPPANLTEPQVAVRRYQATNKILPHTEEVTADFVGIELGTATKSPTASRLKAQEHKNGIGAC